MRWSVGVDSAKDRVDLVVLADGKLAGFYSVDTPKGLISDRSASIKYLRRETKEYLVGMDLDVFVEDAIVVRNPRVAIQLAHTVGMLLSLPHRVQIVTIQLWKQIAVGDGGANKAAVREAIIRRLPETEDLYGKRQDLFDATGVAIYGDSILKGRD